jgi:hypothetical protein
MPVRKVTHLMSDWPDLNRELDEWAATGRPATLWWRDDDAVKPTPQLDRLLTIAKPLPIALAVIPGKAEKELSERLCDCQRITVLQHGWRHCNHGDYSEYPGIRPPAGVKKELQDGRKLMSDFFGERFLPVFVPPWLAFDDKFLPLLSESDLWSISRMGPRGSAAVKAANIFECNVHTDLLTWRPKTKFVGTGKVIDDLIKHLKGRRLGNFEFEEPTGILTHHLDQDEPAFDFIERLAEVTGGHKAAKWLSASEIFRRQAP